ncbi:DNA polymerase III subunit delta [Halosquirtibacter laminarini]|uniref:DNA polymerase III subunit delta n=1 Tax=Halosquirtibacter laminarini TaxID=3374600 RepID=A0AC61NF32_9BACT|nr:DNA polymerase III subunit delta [Prolixibacteraceae bacterium]
MRLKDIVGHHSTKDRLIQMVEDDRLSHAILLTGASGIGKLSLAIAFLQFVHCKSPINHDSCGTCSSCKKISKLIHPDMHFVFPIVKNKGLEKCDHYLPIWRESLNKNPYLNFNSWLDEIDAGNKQAIIYGNESEEVVKKINLKSYEGGYKSLLIWLPEKLNATSANKLLKLIEEPPSKTIMVFVSQEENKILPTIKSRIQEIRCQPLAPDEMAHYLEQTYPDSDSNMTEVARLAQGSMYQAIKIIKKHSQKEQNLLSFQTLMRLSYSRKVVDIIGWAEEMAQKSRENQKDFILYAQGMVRENFVMNMKQPELVYLDHSQKEWSNKFYPFINDRNVETLYHELDLAFRDVSMNGNSKIIFLHLGLMITKYIRV